MKMRKTMIIDDHKNVRHKQTVTAVERWKINTICKHETLI